jgi:hypothetical protein
MLEDAQALHLRCLTIEPSRPRRQGPLADESNMVLGSHRPAGPAEAGRLELGARPHFCERRFVAFAELLTYLS